MQDRKQDQRAPGPGAARPGGHRLRSLGRRSCLLLTLAAAFLLVGMAGAALADSVSISTDPDLVDAKPFRVTLSGNLTTNTSRPELHVRVKAAGGSPCGAYPQADDGRDIWGDYENPSGPGPYSKQESQTLDQGGYLLCAWLMDGDGSSTQPLAAAALGISVRAIHASLGLRVPGSVGLNTPFVIHADYTVELDRDLYAIVKPAGGTGCAASYSLEPDYGPGFSVSDETVFSGGTISGTNAAETSKTLLSYGTYLVCAWIQKGETDLRPAAGPISARVAVADGRPTSSPGTGSRPRKHPRCPAARRTEKRLHQKYMRQLARVRHTRGRARSRAMRAAKRTKGAWTQARIRRRIACTPRR